MDSPDLSGAAAGVDGADLSRPIDALFVNTPLKNYDIEPRFNDYTLPVIGIGYIATVASRAGFNVGVIDAESRGLGVSTVARLVEALDPRWVGLNLLAPTFHLSIEILRQLPPDIRVMVGGHQAKAMPDEILADPSVPSIDALVIGEGEPRVAAILDNESRKRFLPAVRWRDRQSGAVETGITVGSTESWLAPDINELPFVDRRFLRDDPRLAEDGRIEANIVGSRGCPYNCSFCGAAADANPDVDVRTRRPENIVGEMSELADTFDVSAFRFVDDLFLARPTFINAFLEVFEHNGVGDRYVWDATGRINVLSRADDSLLDRLRASGCREVALGVESGSTRLLKYMGKRITPEMTVEAVTRLLRHGISVKGYFILGYPTETAIELEATIGHIEELWRLSDQLPGTFRASAFEFRPYPGTPEWNRLIAAGFAPPDLLRYSHVDLTDAGATESMRTRDEFNFSVGIQFGEVEPAIVRRNLADITRQQFRRTQDAHTI